MSVCDDCPARIDELNMKYLACVFRRTVYSPGGHWLPPESCDLAPILKLLGEAKDVGIGENWFPVGDDKEWVKFWIRR